MRNLTGRYAALTAGSAFIFLFLLFSRGCTRSLVYTPPQELPVEHSPYGDAAGDFDDIWFDAQGRLVSLSRSGLELDLQIRDSRGTVIPSFGWHLNLAEAEGEEFEAGLRYSPRALDPVKGHLREALYAVSSDAKRVAWMINGRLKAQDFSETPPKRIAEIEVISEDTATEQGMEARRISFAGDKIVALIRENGAFELWKLQGPCNGVGCKGTFGNRFGPAQSLWPIDSGILVASPQDLHILKIKSADRGEMASAIVTDLRISALSVGSDGRVAAGTQEGTAVLISGEELKTRTARRLPVAQRIDKVAVFGQGLLAAGDFPGVYAVAGDSVELAIPFEDSIDLLAASPWRIAFVSNGRLWLSEVTTSSKFNNTADRIVSWFSLYLAVLIAIYGFHSNWVRGKDCKAQR